MIDDGNNIKYKFDLNSYKQFLIEDFQRNKDIAELAHTLSFTNAPTMSEWVNGTEGEDFFMYHQTFSFEIFVPDDLMLFVEDIQYKAKYFVQDDKDLYQFFTKKEYNSYEDLAQRENHGYYVYDINFFKSIDNMIFNKLIVDDEYSKYSKGKGIYKQIKPNIFLQLIPKNYTKHSGVAQYFFPDVTLKIGEKDFPLLNSNSGSDIRTLLLLTSDSFIFFYIVSSIFSKPGEFPQSVLLKKDEPIIKMSESKFILTNSEHKLKIFNKYINLTLELYYHYFKVLEKYIAATV